MLPEAHVYVRQWHRHHKPAVGGLFALACAVSGEVCGVAVVGRPVSRMLQDGYTAEVTRLATDGTKNAASMLYAACWRAARAMGYRKLITYILKTETGIVMLTALIYGATCRGRKADEKNRLEIYEQGRKAGLGQAQYIERDLKTLRDSVSVFEKASGLSLRSYHGEAHLKQMGSAVRMLLKGNSQVKQHLETMKYAIQSSRDFCDEMTEQITAAEKVLLGADQEVNAVPPCACAKERTIYSAAEHRNKRAMVGRRGCELCRGSGKLQPCDQCQACGMVAGVRCGKCGGRGRVAA
jgi:hypothetical protein